MSKRYLVTGGGGFIGGAVAEALARSGAEVISLDNGWRNSKERETPGIRYIKADIRDAKAVSDAVKGVDCVCHLAYINGTEYFYSKPELVLEVGVKGIVNVLDACIEHGVRDFILASSSEVYQTPPTVPTDETAPLSIPDPLNPRYSYGGGKIISELMTTAYGRKFFDRACIVRPHNVYGPQMGWEHVVPQFVVRMLELAKSTSGTIPFPIQGTGEETRAFLYISDMADAFLKVVEHGEHLGIYHSGNDEEITISALAHAVARSLGREIEVVPGALQPGGTLRRCPDITKLRKLGFTPQISLEEGLRRTIDWYKNVAAPEK